MAYLKLSFDGTHQQRSRPVPPVVRFAPLEQAQNRADDRVARELFAWQMAALAAQPQPVLGEEADNGDGEISSPEASVDGSLGCFEELELPIDEDPAPTGSECMMHLVRDIKMQRMYRCSSQVEHFQGFLSGSEELLDLKFTLIKERGDNEMNLEICDMIAPFKNGLAPISLARFQQAEVFLQFFAKNKNKAKTLFYEGSEKKETFQISLDLPHARTLPLLGPRRGSFGTANTDRNCDRVRFSIYCPGMIPHQQLNDALVNAHEPAQFLMRVYLKLIKGELNTLYGIQKLFHPDKELLQLREMMSKVLLEQSDVNFKLATGDGKKSFGAHRAILAANSDVFKAMFKHKGMKENKTGQIKMLDYVTSDVLAAFLKYVYTKHIYDLKDDVILTTKVLKLADYYQIQGLVEASQECLLAMPLESFNLDKALSLFQVGESVGVLSLQTKAVHCLMRMKAKFSESDLYLKLVQEDPGFAARLTEMISQFRSAAP